MEPAIQKWLNLPIEQRIINVPTDTNLFRTALRKFPQGELDADKDVVIKHDVRLNTESEEFKLDRVKSRWQNSICGNCKGYGAKSGILRPCLKCGLEFYCSKKCLKAHWKNGHKEYCQACPNVPVDVESPYRLVIHQAPAQAQAEYAKQAVLNPTGRVPTAIMYMPGSHKRACTFC